MELTIIRRFEDPVTAHIYEHHLENEGIDCFIHDEHIVTINPLYSSAVGGVKLKVQSPDAERAPAILKPLDELPYTNDKLDQITCPKCGSLKLTGHLKSMKSVKGILSAVFSFLFSDFPIFFRSVYICKTCNFEFEANK